MCLWFSFKIGQVGTESTFIYFLCSGLRELRRHEPEGGTPPRHLRLRLREAFRHPAAGHRPLHKGGHSLFYFI
jgi:hypothetical protein